MTARTKSSESTDERAEATAEAAERLRAYGREARQEGEAFLHATQGALREVDGLVREQLEARPYATLGTAFGFGVFLGGGLPFGVVRFATRAAAGMLLRELVATALPAGAARS
jgi:ElaB/YqjD/DUF883 family membrane-anchored ribosome-binding protein